MQTYVNVHIMLMHTYEYMCASAHAKATYLCTQTSVFVFAFFTRTTIASIVSAILTVPPFNPDVRTSVRMRACQPPARLYAWMFVDRSHFVSGGKQAERARATRRNSPGNPPQELYE